MTKRFRIYAAGRFVLSGVVTASLLVGLLAWQGSASAGSHDLSAAAVAAALSSSGPVVRRDGDITVEDVGSQVSARVPGTGSGVWRVSVPGDFPPLDDRYEILADGNVVAYGMPSPDMNSLIAATNDPAVLTGDLTVQYGNGPLPASNSVPKQQQQQPSPQQTPQSDATATMRHPMSTDPTRVRATGPLAVTKTTYTFGNAAYHPPGLVGKVELTADVHYPTGLPGGPYPLVIFMHGNHDSCYQGASSFYEWPCSGSHVPLPNYEGYDYIASELASYGYIVVSVSADGVNVLGNQVGDTGMTQRADVIEQHIGLWNTWNTGSAAPFGTTFVGKVDMTKIGVMGHSRGGEGAVYSPIVDASQPSPYGIDAVLALAPVDFTRALIPNIPFDVMLPYCDGDVSDLQGVHFFDDSRYTVPGDPAPKSTVTVFGANHNFFNTVWTPGGSAYPGGSDDGAFSSCPDASRLTAAQERTVGSAYISSFFRRYLGNDRSLDSIFTGASTPGIAPATTLVSYLAPDKPSKRLDIDRFTNAVSMTTNAQGGAVTATNLTKTKFCPDSNSNPCVPGGNSFADIHLTGLGQGVFGWSGRKGSVKFTLPGGKSVSGYHDLQFRVAVNPGYKANNGIATQNLVVKLTDGSGHSSAVAASAIDNRPLDYPLDNHGNGHMILNQLRFPLNKFSGLSLGNIRSVQIKFSKTDSGVIDIADLNFSRGAA